MTLLFSKYNYYLLRDLRTTFRYTSRYQKLAINRFSVKSCNMSEEQKAAVVQQQDAVETGEKPKTAKQLEKEKKLAEKLAKFEAKKLKQAQLNANLQANTKKKNAKKETEVVPEFIDQTKPGEKKILVSLDDPSLKAYSPKNIESSWYEWWCKEGFFKPALTEDGKVKPEGVFTIPAPPPNVTGALHIGHALTVSIQDALIRYNRMKGKTTLFIPGFDHAGIATQSVVEKTIWTKEKKTRHDYGREAFVDKVWEWKEVYHLKIKSQFKSLGASYDWSREAFTMDPARYKAVMEAFVTLHERGVIYRASRLINWCVHLNTALSNLEVDNKVVPGKTLLSVPGYTDKVEFGVLTSFAYPVVGSDEKLVVATTRPETIFGDTGVAVHPDDSRYKHLHGKFVQHPFLDKQIPIITDAEAVDMEFGTGAVKITPAHDTNDYATGKRQNLEFVNILTDDGLLNENCGEKWVGIKRFDARKLVIEELKAKGLFVEQKDNEMTIPICSRSGDVIEPYLKPQWWVAQSEIAKEGIKVVKEGKIKITPKSSEAEYFRWLENTQDWCISRQLWWGHRCPVYFVNIEGETNDSNDGEYWISGRTLEEAEKKAAIKFPNSKYTLEQDEDVLDTWFSAGLWPFSTLGWPEKTDDMAQYYPMSMLETGWDILFFWVVRMILMGLQMTGEVPFKEVFCHSLVRDAQGRKMSKSLGNVINPTDVITGIALEDLHKQLLSGNLDPREVAKATEGQKLSYPNGIPECGTDALRFALCAYTTGGRDINLDILRVEGYRKFCNKIYQATKFALMRLGDDYKPPAEFTKLTGNESLVEKWILHKLTLTAGKLNESLEKRDFFEATNSIYQFWYDLCDVYIENSKYLILEGSPSEQKSAKDTLYTCIDQALKLIHPFMPFITEEMWQRLPRREGDLTKSIVISEYPTFNENFSNPESLNEYDLVLEITKGLRSILSQYNILKNGKAFVETANSKTYQIANEQKAFISSMIKAVNEVGVVKTVEELPQGCALQSITPDCNVHVLVKGEVDIDLEISKTESKLSKLNKQKEALFKTINTPGYSDKASVEVQTTNKDKIEKNQAEIEGLLSTIKNLENLKL